MQLELRNMDPKKVADKKDLEEAAETGEEVTLEV